MSVYESQTEIAALDAPWGKKVRVDAVVHPGGLAMARVRIQEGRRFTDLELDADTAAALGRTLAAWAEENAPG